MKLALVACPGGHMAQLLRLRSAYQGHEHFFVSYQSEGVEDLEGAYLLPAYFHGIKVYYMVASGFVHAWRILRKERPAAILTTGAGELAIPFCYVGKLLGIKIVYIDSLTRTNSKSLGGRLIYPIADLFLVQWERMREEYGSKAQYWGKVI